MLTAERNKAKTQNALDSIGTVVDKYAHFPTKEARDAVVLWIAHSWVYDKFETTPRLGLYSSEYGSGKSQVMNLVAGMAPNNMNAVNVRPSMLYQAIESSENLVFTIDEIDQIFGKRGSNSSHRQLQAVLNEGFSVDGKTVVTNGPETTREVSLFTPVVTAGVGHVPDALKTRSIRIKLRRAPSDVVLAEYRTRKVRLEFNHVKEVLDSWSRECGPWLEFHMPEMPVKDRAGDKWEPLFAIADMAGDTWLRNVSRSCKLLESSDEDTEGVPLSVQLLRDIKDVLDEREETETIFTSVLIASLVFLGWDEQYVHPKLLAKILGQHGVESTTVRQGEEVAKGYYVEEIRYAISKM